MHQSIPIANIPPGTFLTWSNLCFSGGGDFAKIPPPGGQKLGQKSSPRGKFFTFFNTVIVICRPKGGLLILQNLQLGSVPCVAGKNMNFYIKSPTRSLLTGRLRHDDARKNIPLFGINQMLVSATGGDGSLPSKNHVKIGSLRKLTCERLFRMATCHSPISSN